MKVINHMCLNEAVASSYRHHLTAYVNFSNEANWSPPGFCSWPLNIYQMNTQCRTLNK